MRGLPGMSDSEPTAARPWYRFFWPWFIFALLFASVVAGIATVVIAFSNRDSLVSEAWYERGVQINRRLEAEANAARRSIRAELRIDNATGEVRVDLAGRGVETVRELVLELSHPTRASSDRSIELVRRDAGPFRAQLRSALSGRWYAVLEPSEPTAPDDSSSGAAPAGAGSWLLSATLYLPSSEPLILGGSG